MVTKAIARYIRISPRKTRKVLDLVRGMPVVRAEAMLQTVNKRPTIYVRQLLNSAINSAEKRFNLSPADLYISVIKADQGPILKRFRAASMGRATSVKHRTTHITLELDRIKRPEKKVKEPQKKATRPARQTRTIKKEKKVGAKGTSV